MRRLAAAALGEGAVRHRFQTQMEGVIGLPGAAGALGTALSDFRTALGSAIARPDDDIRLAQVASTASALARGLNTASAAVQEARSTAQQAIAADITALVTVDFATEALKMPLPPGAHAFRRWYEKVAARPSAKA